MTEDDSRQRGIETMKKKYGEDHFKKIGSKGGKNSTTKFNSDSAREAAQARWDKVNKLKEKSNDK